MPAARLHRDRSRPWFGAAPPGDPGAAGQECTIESPISYRTARRIVVAVVGATLLGLGLALLFLPGPGLLVIAIGLALLSSEFVWAKHWLARVREEIGRTRGPRAACPATRTPAEERSGDP